MMRITLLVTLAAACGGGKKAVDEPPAVADTPRESSGDPPAPPEMAAAEPAAATSIGAKAALEPVKGAKQPPGTVTFTQGIEGTSVTSDFQGLRPGRYHLVVHDGNECGESAAKAGPPWKGAEGVKLSFGVGGDEPGNIEESNVGLRLDGVAPIIGQTLALHDDKKGQPGKILACGTIDAVGATP
jgi:hypothetical protein